MKKRYLFILLAAMLALGPVFTACDVFEPGSGIGAGMLPETWEDLVILGEDSDGRPVRIEFSRSTAEKQALTPSTLKNDDNYIIYHDGKKVSGGTIKINGSTVAFIPLPTGSGLQFQGTFITYNGVIGLNLPDGVVPSSTGGTIKGYHNGGGSVDNSAAYTVAGLLNSNNAVVDRGNVVIKGPVVVTKNVPIPVGVKLVFDTKESDEFKINMNVTVTAKSGIEVISGGGVTISGDGSLIVEGSATVIRGKMNVSGGTTLDIPGIFTIENGGILSICGDDTVQKVYHYKFDDKHTNASLDAVLKLGGTLTVKYGGRFLLPDPYKFNLRSITGEIDVEAGGELILITIPYGPVNSYGSNKKIEPFLHPLIGTVSTETTGVPLGADYVMDPSSLAVPSKIVMRVNSGVPAFELTGRAIALGRLIFEEDYPAFQPVQPQDNKTIPPYRREVYLEYPFTLLSESVLQVGNRIDKPSSLMVTGPDFFVAGLNAGVLTNDGKVLIFQNSGLIEWFGGYFDHKDMVRQYAGNDSASMTPAFMWFHDGFIYKNDVVANGNERSHPRMIRGWEYTADSPWVPPPWLHIWWEP